MRGFVAVCCVLAGLIAGAGSEVVSGESEDNDEGFQYLAKFVYEYARAYNSSGAEIDTQQMRIEVTLELGDDDKIRADHRPQNWVVLLYDDEETQCSSVTQCPAGCHKDAKTCSGTPDAVKGFETVMYAVRHHKQLPYMENGVIQSDKPPKQLLCDDILDARAERFDVKWDDDGTYMYKESRFIRNRLRDRAFYAVLATNDCKPLSEGVNWRIHFANGGGRVWSEFGANEQGLVIMYIVFMLAYFLLCGAQIYSRTIYRYTHHLPRLFTASLASQTFATIFFTIHYFSFMMGGEPKEDDMNYASGHPLFKFFGELATVFSRIVFVLMLVLIAQGWTILRGEVQYRRVIVGLIASMTAGSFLLLLWDVFTASASTEADNGALSWFLRDPASLTYLYTTLPGFGLLCIDLAAAGVFIACCFWTVQRAEELRRRGQRAFLVQIGIAFGAYLALMPILVDIVAIEVDPWVREKWIRTIQMCGTLAAHSGMLVLIWPTRAEKHFLEAGNFNKAPTGGFVSPFASGGSADGDGSRLSEALLDESDDAYYGGF